MPIMGATSSKDTELENALSKFEEGQAEKLREVFDSLSRNNILDKSKLKVGDDQEFLRSFLATLLLCKSV